jgi:membrane protein YdbS with pleckstrin-like domain
MMTLSVVFLWLSMAWVALPIAADGGGGAAAAYLGLLSAALVVCWLIGMSLTGPYYRSLRYEIEADEVIVHAGIVTKSVKHVPYRTVTNITIKRGILDRWFFNLGTLNIQTAGMSGTQGAEESLQGLPDVHAVYDIVVAELRRFRGSMSPTAAGMEGEVPVALSAASDATLQQLLIEVQAIRESLAG